MHLDIFDETKESSSSPTQESNFCFHLKKLQLICRNVTYYSEKKKMFSSSFLFMLKSLAKTILFIQFHTSGT